MFCGLKLFLILVLVEVSFNVFSRKATVLQAGKTIQSELLCKKHFPLDGQEVRVTGRLFIIDYMLRKITEIIGQQSTNSQGRLFFTLHHDQYAHIILWYMCNMDRVEKRLHMHHLWTIRCENIDLSNTFLTSQHRLFTAKFRFVFMYETVVFRIYALTLPVRISDMRNRFSALPALY